MSGGPVEGERRTVLYVSTPHIMGGAEISLLAAMRNLDSRRYRAVLLTTPGSMIVAHAEAAGIRTDTMAFHWRSRRRPLLYWSSIWKLCLTVREFGCCIVHSNCDHSLRYVYRVAAICRKPWVAHVRDFVRSWFVPANVDALAKATRVLVSSGAMRRACIEHGLRAERMHVIPSPIAVEQFAAERSDLRSDLGVMRDAFVVGYVGQIQDIKGVSEYVAAAIEAQGEIPKAVFLVVGGASDEAGFSVERALREEVESRGLGYAFRFVGHRTDVTRVMRTLDVLVVPSWCEPFGRVAVEGMAAGLPVIGTASGGLPEIIEDGVSGVLVPPRDVAALRNAMIGVSRDRLLSRSLGERGRAAASRFAVEAHVEALQDLYDEVCGPGVGTGGLCSGDAEGS